MDSGTGDAAVSRTSPVRAGWMGLLTGRAGRAVVRRGHRDRHDDFGRAVDGCTARHGSAAPMRPPPAP